MRRSPQYAIAPSGVRTKGHYPSRTASLVDCPSNIPALMSRNVPLRAPASPEQFSDCSPRTAGPQPRDVLRLALRRGGEVSEGGRGPLPSSLAVDVFAGGGFGGAGGVPLLPQEHLPQPDRPTVEGNGRAGQVQAPRAVDLLAHESARLVGAGLEPLHPVAAGARVVEPQILDVDDLPLGALHLRQSLGDAEEIPVGEDVPVEEIRLARVLPVELVVDAVAQVQPAGIEHVAHAAEDGAIVRDPHVLDDSDGGDLVVPRPLRDIAEIAVLDHATPLEALALDARLRPFGLGARESDSVRLDTVVLGRPDGEPSPSAADVEHGLTGLETELAADEIDLVLLRLLELTVGLAVVRAGVEHEGIEEERVELVRDIVVVRDRLRVPLLARASHHAASRMPKMLSNTMRRRAAATPRMSRTATRAIDSGRRPSWRSSQRGSPGP